MRRVGGDCVHLRSMHVSCAQSLPHDGQTARIPLTSGAWAQCVRGTSQQSGTITRRWQMAHAARRYQDTNATKSHVAPHGSDPPVLAAARELARNTLSPECRGGRGFRNSSPTARDRRGRLDQWLHLAHSLVVAAGHPVYALIQELADDKSRGKAREAHSVDVQPRYAVQVLILAMAMRTGRARRASIVVGPCVAPIRRTARDRGPNDGNGPARRRPLQGVAAHVASCTQYFFPSMHVFEHGTTRWFPNLATLSPRQATDGERAEPFPFEPLSVRLCAACHGPDIIIQSWCCCTPSRES